MTVPARSEAFLAGDGEMAALMRSFPWDDTSLGATHAWPRPLKATIRMALTTRHPALIFWGGEHLCLYNDAFRATLDDDHHRTLLGRPGHVGWSTTWPLLRPHLEAVLSGGGPSRHANQRIPLPRQGQLVDTYWTCSYGPIDDESTPLGVGGVLALCTETTTEVNRQQLLRLEQERFATLLRRSEERFRMAVESTGLGTFDIALGSGEAHLSDTALALFGMSDTKPTLSELAERVEPEDRELLNAMLHDAIATPRMPNGDRPDTAGTTDPANGQAYRIRLRIRAGPNDVRHLSIAGKVDTGDGPGGEPRATGIVLDLTEQQTLVETLRTNDQRKDEFLATLAHELRNPLAALRSASYLLGRPGVSAERIRWCGEVIQRQSKSMALLLDDLMEVSRITRGKVELKREMVQLKDVVDAAIETARPFLEDSAHRLELELPPEPVVFQADPLRIAQVLSNLLSNAARYSPAGSTVQLIGEVDGADIRLRVADTGIGISPERLPHLFDMFNRSHLAEGGSTGGLGVGLAVSKGLVDLHGGRLDAFSGGLGRGSTFTVTLPRVQIAPAEPVAPPVDADPVAPALRVLVADDNVDAAEAIATLLRLDGYQVDVVHDGLSALHSAREHPPFAAFLDIGMPGMDGYQLATQIRRQPWGVQLFLVAVTGWGQGADRDRALAAGFDLHLTKPVDLESVAGLLARRRDETENGLQTVPGVTVPTS